MKRYCIGGFKKSTHESTHKSLRKKFEKYTIYKPDELPAKVDLRPWMNPVEDQSEINAWYVSKYIQSSETLKILNDKSEKLTRSDLHVFNVN
jgi:hypothetical protein